MSNFDTIAAISTAPGEGGVGIVRISGPDAITVGMKVFRSRVGKKELSERKLYFGDFLDAAGAATDEGFFVLMKGPRSYTGEDVVELHCHGGQLVLKKVLEAVLKAGARLAEPGEFTKRAFLSGKLDLAQAEAVADIIRAQTEASLGSAHGRLSGQLSRRIGGIKERLFILLVRLEAELDFPEDEIESISSDEIAAALAHAKDELGSLLATYEEGAVKRDGVRVLILGRPNVGKSSLLNVLLREERAIVTPIPGTTRDVIEETLNIRGIPVRLMDTAGLRATDDHVEAIGVRAARERVRDAGLILFVVEAAGLLPEDIEELNALEGKRVIVVANKTDLAEESCKTKLPTALWHRVEFISALNSTGIEGLKDAVYAECVGRSYGADGPAEGEMIVSLRHKVAVEAALDGVLRAGSALEKRLAREFIATDIRFSIDRLGEITGETTTEDILESIFNTFCIGK